MVEYTTALNVVKEKILEEVYQALRMVNHKLNEKDIDRFTMIALIHIIKVGRTEKIDMINAVRIEELAESILKDIDKHVLFPTND